MMKLLAVVLGVVSILGCTTDKEVPLTYRDSGGYFSKPVIGPDDTVYVGALNKCFYAFNPNGTVKWKYASGGSIHSDPARASDGTLFFGSKNKYVHTLNSDGTVRWRCQLNGPVEAGAALSPDGKVYFATMKGSIYAFDQKSQPGQVYQSHKKCTDAPLLWSTKTPKGSNRIKFTPIVVDDHIIVGNEKGGKKAKGLLRFQASDGTFVNSIGARDAFRIGGEVHDGVLYTAAYNEIMAVKTDLSEKLWGFSHKQVHRSHPVLSPDKKTVYQASREDGVLFALNASDGSVKWQLDLGAGVVMTPGVDPVTGVIYVGQASGGPYFFAINPDGTEKWKSDTSNSLRSTPGLSNDRSTVYTGGSRGRFFALDTTTGIEQWFYEAGPDKPACKKMG